MAKAKETEAAEVQPEEAAPLASGKAKSFVVLDSNGKVFREVKDAEDASALAESIGGRVAK